MNSRVEHGADDSRQHARKIKEMLNGSRQRIREDITKVSDPKAQALFETSAEVLCGPITAYEHFEQRNEAAWK